MVESGHFIHPYFKIPVYSLYSETRSPTPAMLDGIDHIVVDLQDIGCRAYTFMYTLTLMMEACGRQGVGVVVLDRPNPINGRQIEGNLLDERFISFIGRHPLPMRHGMTIGEIARMAQSFWNIQCQLDVVSMLGWERKLHFGETQLPWVFPSPNMPHIKTAHIFPATVLLEGTNLSEGRGTTRPFELFGHPTLQPHHLLDHLEHVIQKHQLGGFALRPLYFQPTFDKHQGRTCGGFQLHLTDRRVFRPWRTGLILLRELYRYLGDNFQWRQPPFEYEDTLMPIDLLHGTDRLRHWVERQGDPEELDAIEQEGMENFLEQRKAVMLYPSPS